MGWLVLGALGAGYLLVCGAAFAMQRELIFPAPKEGRAPRAGVTMVEVPGATLFLWRPPPVPGGPVVVHFHGNAEQAADMEWLAEPLGEAGAGLALVEYPGYGLAAGKGSPSEDALVEAGEKALSHLTQVLGVSRGQLVLSGQSLGSGVAVELARRGWGRKLLLFTPYTSLPDVAAAAFPFLPTGLLMRDRFESLDKAAQIRVPVLVVHGTRDEVIPQRLGRALAARFPSGRFLSVEGGHHNDLWDQPGVTLEATRFLVSP